MAALAVYKDAGDGLVHNQHGDVGDDGYVGELDGGVLAAIGFATDHGER